MAEIGIVAFTTTQIEKRIHEAVATAVRHLATSETAITGAMARETRLHLIMNSSFLYRDKRSVKTIQSSKRLVTRLTMSGKHARPDVISIIDGAPFTSHYRLLSAKDITGLIPLQDAVSRELASVGDLIFVLIGTVQGLRPCAKPTDCGAVKKLRLAPSLPTEFQRVSAGVYAFKRILPVEDLLAQIGHDLEAEGGLSEKVGQAIAKAYDSLLDDATTDVIVPTDRTVSPKDTTLGKIVGSLRAKAQEYDAAVKELQRAPDDQHALNEVLRIAYNFSTDVLPLISLFMSICDLKPLVFWCTVGKQWELYRAFASLPWSVLGRKEKLEEYQSIVSEARNSAFHHVLPFDATVEVDLSNLDVRAEKIRLFSPFGQKHGRGVLLKDQELADVFAEFTRARQRPVSNAFWQANLEVMKAACELAEAVLESLILIHAAKKPGM